MCPTGNKIITRAMVHTLKIDSSFYYTPAPPEKGGYTVLPLYVLPSVPRYFSSQFSQQILMSEI